MLTTFDLKIKNLENKLANIEYIFGYNYRKAIALREQIAEYKKVQAMDYVQISDEIEQAAGRIERNKINYYGYKVDVGNERRLLKILAERIKADRADTKHNITADSNMKEDVQVGMHIE